MLALLCLLSVVASALAATMMPCICTMEYMPVCGVDGKTYGNKCDLNCAGVAEAHPGECAEVCPCPKIYDPVCGQDGKTYSNKCMLNCAGIALFQEGACSATSAGAVQADPADEEPCICTFIYWPVCGTDGITYGNDCNRLCAGAALSHEGPCLGSPTSTVASPVA